MVFYESSFGFLPGEVYHLQIRAADFQFTVVLHRAHVLTMKILSFISWLISLFRELISSFEMLLSDRFASRFTLPALPSTTMDPNLMLPMVWPSLARLTKPLVCLLS